jgi:hypothetical protein
LFSRIFLRIHGHFLNSIPDTHLGGSQVEPATLPIIKLQNRYFRVVTIRHHKLFRHRLNFMMAGFGNIPIDRLIAIALTS